MQRQLNENQPNSNFSVEPTDERQIESAGNDRVEKTDQNSVATGLHNWVYVINGLGGKTLVVF